MVQVRSLIAGIVLPLVLSCASGKDCFQSGECRDSFHIRGEIVNDEFGCLDFCKSVQDCVWSTFFPDTGYCELLKTCSGLDQEACPYCLTAARDCVPDPPSCLVGGECQGIVDQVVRLPGHDECLRRCNDALGCRWVTFHAAATECILLKSCPLLDESCTSCVSSERRCLGQPPKPKDLTKLLVAGGSSYLSTVEVVNLDQSKPDLVCKNLPDLPVGVVAATGKLFQDSTPIICGGATQGVLKADSCNCYGLNNGAWVALPSLNECRKYAESSTVRLDSLTEVLLVVGGKVEEETSGTVEAYDGGVGWKDNLISEVPLPVWEQCLAKVNETTLLSVGGVTVDGDVVADTFFYDVVSDRWTPGPALNDARSGHGCAVLRWTNPDTRLVEPIVVTAGGFLQHSTELLRLNGGKGWVYGARLPEFSFLSEMIEHGESVVVVGGGKYTDGSSRLYRLSTPDGDWVEMGQSLKEERRGHVAFLVPDEIVDCQ